MPDIVAAYPRRVREIENAWITLSDGCRLAVRIWLPEDAEHDPVPAVLEYLPYRKRDGTAVRDAEMHPFVAGHGYACLRVDMRGCGDSDGLLLDEYTQQEQDDALEVIAWAAAQSWCSGAVGMIGISWGGFNGLQVAARRPPALRAVVSLCSTDDRYADDIHFMGGALLLNNLTWGSTMVAHMSRPPDPAISGEAWRAKWLHRLENAVQFSSQWLHHQTRDALWRHGSVCEDFSAITCPVYAVGGWMDGYSNAIPRLLAGLHVPRKGLIGPWAHAYPQSALPGPQIGFLQETVRWWDQWLRGRDTGMMAEPQLRAWMLDSMRPAAFHAETPGHWVADAAWPPQTETHTLFLNADGLRSAPGEAGVAIVASPEDCGAAAGAWCPYGTLPDNPMDQRDDDAKSRCFDGPVLAEALPILGAPVLELDVAADTEQAHLVVRLCEVHPDGASTRVTYGVLNLTHRHDHAEPVPIVPGEAMRVRVALNDVGATFAAGSRLRVALSNAYWPTLWPSPVRGTLRITLGSATLTLPVRRDRPEDLGLAPFPPAQIAPRLVRTELRPGAVVRRTEHDHASGERTFVMIDDSGRHRHEPTGIEVATRRQHQFRVRPDDPLSASAETTWDVETGRGDWQTRSHAHTRMWSTRDTFMLETTLDAFEGDTRVFSREWHDLVPRA